MPRVRFSRIGLEVEVPVGTSLLEAARRSGAPVGSHCGGVCACSKCHIYVEAGAESLSPMAEDEDDMLDLAARERRPSSRLGCQTRLVGDGGCHVRISDESFEEYLDDEPADRDQLLRRWLEGERNENARGPR